MTPKIKKRSKALKIRRLGKKREAQWFGPGMPLDLRYPPIRKNPKGGPFDREAARELLMYAENNAGLYHSREVPIWLNLQKKWKRGSYDNVLAVKLWGYWAEDAAKRYAKEFLVGTDWSSIFSPKTRHWVAETHERYVRAEFEIGNFMMETKRNPPEGILDAAHRLAHELHDKKSRAVRLNHRNELSVPERHMIKIAKQTLGMPDAMVGVMGGPSKEEALEILRRYGIKYQENPITLVGAFGNPRKKRYIIQCVTCRYAQGNVTKVQAVSLGRTHADTTGHSLKVSVYHWQSNPPRRTCHTIDGVVYNDVHEVKAEKTGYMPGLYKHPFEEGSRMLALDSGGLLIENTRGKKLWKRD